MTLGRLVGGLLERGHRVNVLRPQQGPSDQPRINGQYAEHLFPGMQIPMYQSLRFGFPATRRLRKIWQQRRPDAIYVATEGPFGWSAVRAADTLGIPLLSGFHTNFHTYSRHYRLRALEPLILGYLRRMHRRTRCTLVPTRVLAQQLRNENFGCVEVLQRGVDTGLFNPARRSSDLRREWGVDNNELVCLYVGRIAAEKNILQAVAAFGSIQQIVPGARFVLVGDGPMTADLRRNNPEFIFRGMRHGEDLAAHYASGDLFLFPSQSETFGNVVTEAMASGLAVVAYNQAAAGEHIRDSENGALAADTTQDSFCRRARAIAEHPEQLRAIGASAAEHCTSLHWDNIIERFCELLETHIREPDS